jgi:ribonuclease P protein subunit RPR2
LPRKTKYYRKPPRQVEIAKKRIKFLFGEAKNVFRLNSGLSDKYVKTARKLAMKYKIRIDSEFKKKFCSHCYGFFMPGVNSRIRIHKHRIVYYCNKCRNYTRIPIK